MIRALLCGIAVLAIGTPALFVHFAPPPPGGRPSAQRRVVPEAELPPVEPTRYVELTPDDARVYNASVPFAFGPKPAARPFRFTGTAIDRARATDCLAAAVLYEAGDDAVGEKAVAQVVVNRLRHPAFPKTVCGVVFEGASRSTGCQFTFTCDGALTRWQPAPPAWSRAQAIAAQALNGAVYRPVGYATHYHTEWVVPYWQSSLDKIAKVGTHLFFRWTGWWGTPPAFDRKPAGPEPVMAALAPLTGETTTVVDVDLPPIAPPTPETIAPIATDPNSFLVTLPSGLPPDLWPELAARACGDRPLCRLSAWAARGATPATLPLALQDVATMSFSYLRDRRVRWERTLWNCQQTPRVDRSQCMRIQALGAPVPAPAAPLVAAPLPGGGIPPPRGPGALDGVRRHPALTLPGIAPVPAPSASPLRLRFDAAATPSPAADAQQRSAP